MPRKRLEKKAWFEAPELGFRLLIRYVPVPEMDKMRQRATETVQGRGLGQPIERLDPKLYAAEIAPVILDWQEEGQPEHCLSRETYEKFINIDPEDYPAAIPCEDEFKRELLLEARWFPGIVLEMCTNLALIQKKQLAAEIKNS